MAIPAARKTAPATGCPRRRTCSRVLVAQKVLSAEQAEKVRRAQKVNGLSAEQAVLQLGARERRADRPGPRRPRRPALRQDQPARPRPRRGDEGDRRPVRPQARHRGDRQDRATRITIAVHDPFAPFPARGHQARHRARRRPGGRDAQRRRGGQQGLLRPQVEPPARGEAAHREPHRHRRPRQPGVPLQGRRPTSTPRRRPW